ncbi:hypothetical protein MNBD_GAMMA22-1205 [hydrothermal vent metagenome]|uniref:Carbon storage regulator n=1 Tax=hydrothermal vent metagenome TaxID=652676 RepID=A0A3B0ZXD1_9ZZZZ
MNYDHKITLKLGDKLKIGDETIMILSRFGTANVHFACEAPRHISILRQEVNDKKIELHLNN